MRVRSLLAKPNRESALQALCTLWLFRDPTRRTVSQPLMSCTSSQTRGMKLERMYDRQFGK